MRSFQQCLVLSRNRCKCTSKIARKLNDSNGSVPLSSHQCPSSLHQCVSALKQVNLFRSFKQDAGKNYTLHPSIRTAESRNDLRHQGHRLFVAGLQHSIWDIDIKQHHAVNLHSKAEFSQPSNVGDDLEAAEDMQNQRDRHADSFMRTAGGDRARRGSDFATFRARANSRLELPAYWIPAAPAAPPPSGTRIRDPTASASAAAAASLAAEITAGRPLDAATWDQLLMAADPTECLRAVARRSLICGPNGVPAEPALAWMAQMIDVRCAPRTHDRGGR